MPIPDATAVPHRTVEEFIEETANCSQTRLVTGLMLHEGRKQPFLVFCVTGTFHPSAMQAISEYLKSCGSDPVAQTRVERSLG